MKRGAGGPESHKDRIRSVRRRQVLQLIKDRHGGHLPNNAVGRSDLQLLLELGLTGPEAQRLALWIAGNELERLIYAADNNWPAWSRSNGTPAALIGERVRLRFEEYARLGLWHLHPHDCGAEKLKDFRKKRRQEKDRRRKRGARACSKTTRAHAANNDPDVMRDPLGVDDLRQSLVLMLLNDGNWWTVRRLAEYARSKPLGAFKGLDYDACRQAVLRAVRKLEELGLVQTRKEDERGRSVLYARCVWTLGELEANRQQMMQEVSDEQKLDDE
jgi:hypothetical protein